MQTVPPYIAAYDHAPPGMVPVDSQLNHASACTRLPLDAFGVTPNGYSFSVRSRCEAFDPNLYSFINAGWDGVNSCGNYPICQGYFPSVIRKAPTCPPGYSLGIGVCTNSGGTVAQHKAKGKKPCKPCVPGQPRPPVLVANPINPLTGNKSQTEVDYASPSAFGLSVVRTYNSRIPLPGIFGMGWASSFDRRVEPPRSFQGNTATAVWREDGAVLNFALINGVWTGDSDVNDRLEQLPSGWRYTGSRDDAVEVYDAAGRLLSVSNRAGLTLTLSYNGAGQLSQVADAFGRTLAFTFNAQGRVATVTDPAAAVIAYAYDGNGNLASVTYPGSQTKTYHYENTTYVNALTGISDENQSRFATFAYDSSGRATLSEHAGGVERSTVSYSSPITVTDARGSAQQYTYQVTLGVPYPTVMQRWCNHASCGGNSPKWFSYDANGNVSSHRDFLNNRTNYTYDLTRNVETQRVEGLTSSGATTAVTRTTSRQWHSTFGLQTGIAEPKRITTFQYDSQGNLTSKSVQATTDTNGALGFSATPTGSPRVWTYAHTYHGTIPGFITQTVVDGPRTDATDTTAYVYDTTTGALASVTNALGHATTFGNYDAHGRAQRITDPNGLITDLTYDPRGRLTARDVGGEITGYHYDAAGQLTKVTLPGGSYLTYTYDAAHRLTQIQDNLGNQIAYTLDAMGNRTKEEVRDPAASLKRKRERAYNSLNQLIKDIGGVNPASEITQYGYDADGNLTTVTDPLAKLTTHQYDQLNRLKKMIDPAATGSGQGGNTQYAYDGLDALTQVTDPRNLATTYTLNGLGSLTQQVSADTGTTSNSYDAAGNLTGQTDARGVVGAFVYDALNRLTQAVYTPPGGSGITAVTRTYNYDQGSYGKGKLTAFTDPSGSTAYTWNQKGRLTAEARTLAGVQYTTGYGYDSTGRLNRITYPSGRTVDYGFDAVGRIQQIDTTAGSVTRVVVSAVAYHPFGGTTGFTYGNATTYNRAYDLNGRVNAYSLGNLSRTVTYDAASRITGFTHNQSAYDQAFGYDNLARLASWTSNSTTRAFGYDALHNRTSETIGASNYTYSYPGTSNRLTSVTGPIARSYTYDAAGNPTADGTHTFGHDASGRMINVTWGSINGSYQLNALGQRVYKAPSNAAATVFHYDTDGRLIAESNAAGQVQREYIYLNGIPVAVALGTAQSDLYFLHPDHLDTPRVVTNSANTIVWRWDSADPLGSALTSEDPDGNGQSFTLNLRFPGQYFDQETQLHYNYYRDYDPQTGRYIQADPIGLRGGINIYVYASSAPVQRRDPLGLMDMDVEPAITNVTAREVYDDMRRQYEAATAAECFACYYDVAIDLANPIPEKAVEFVVRKAKEVESSKQKARGWGRAAGKVIKVVNVYQAMVDAKACYDRTPPTWEEYWPYAY